MRHRRSRTVSAAGFAFALTVVLAGPAAAHAVLLGSQPADEATVTEPLAEVVLEFSEAVRDVQVQVADPAGDSIVDGRPDVRGDTVVQAIEQPAGHGEYSVAFRVVSEDDHPVGGEFTFTYAGPIEDPAPEPTPTPEGTPTPVPEAAPSPAPPTDEPAEDDLAAAPLAPGGPPVGLIALVLLVLAAGAAGWAFRRRAAGGGEGGA